MIYILNFFGIQYGLNTEYLIEVYCYINNIYIIKGIIDKHDI